MNQLYETVKRLLEYSGSKIIEISNTKDGVVAEVEFFGKRHKIFVAPIDYEADSTLKS